MLPLLGFYCTLERCCISNCIWLWSCDCNFR